MHLPMGSAHIWLLVRYIPCREVLQASYVLLKITCENYHEVAGRTGKIALIPYNTMFCLPLSRQGGTAT
jgi:hypothetical protein